jgi:hypothetical protein
MEVGIELTVLPRLILNSTILLPHPSDYWDYRGAPPHSVINETF